MVTRSTEASHPAFARRIRAGSRAGARSRAPPPARADSVRMSRPRVIRGEIVAIQRRRRSPRGVDGHGDHLAREHAIREAELDVIERLVEQRTLSRQRSVAQLREVRVRAASTLSRDPIEVAVEHRMATDERVEIEGLHLLHGGTLRQANTRLRESDERFRQLAENVRGVFWLEEGGWQRLLYVSPASEEFWDAHARASTSNRARGSTPFVPKIGTSCSKVWNDRIGATPRRWNFKSPDPTNPSVGCVMAPSL